MIPVESSANGKLDSYMSDQKRILDKVWSNVEKVMAEMKSLLLSKLQDPSRSVEEQEKTIESAVLLFLRRSCLLMDCKDSVGIERVGRPDMDFFR